jgi:hypothetical protein
VGGFWVRAQRVLLVGALACLGAEFTIVSKLGEPLDDVVHRHDAERPPVGVHQQDRR